MEKLYKGNICKLVKIDEFNNMQQYSRETIEDSRIFIGNDTSFIDIETGKEYPSLMGARVITTTTPVTEEFVTDVKPYNQVLSDKEILTVYLKALQTKRLYEERKEHEKSFQKAI